MMFRPIEYHPALAESGYAVGFGQTVERYRQKVGGERGNMVVNRAVIKDFVVNLVGENN